MVDWEKYRRNGMNAACTIDLCKAFDDIYSFELSETTNAEGKRKIAHARLKECERLMEIGSRQEAAGLLSGVAYTLGLVS
jgi:hypothetical protein